MSDKPYPRDCKGCGKRIILGIDSSTQKWLPWDDYERGVNHQCSGTGKKLQQQSAKVNGNNDVLDKLNEITNKQATMMWMLQKIAAKIGVESQSGQS